MVWVIFAKFFTDKLGMIKNQEFVEKLFSSLKDPFGFEGEVKFYYGRVVDESKAKVFSTEDEYMDFLVPAAPTEFIVILKSKREAGVRLIDEIVSFIIGQNGERKLHFYEDLTRDRSKEYQMCVEGLKRELRAIIEESKPKRSKKRVS